MKYIYFCLLLLFFCSCAKKADENDLMSMQPKSVQGKVMNADILAQFSSNFEVINSHFYIFRGGIKDETLILSELDGQQIASFGQKGNGPEDHIIPCYTGRSNDTIFMYDTSLRRISSFLITQNERGELIHKFITNIKHPIDDEGWVLDMCRLDNGMYVGLPYTIEEGVNSVFILYDCNLNEITRFGDLPFPLMGNENFYRCFNNSRLFAYKNTIYFAAGGFPYIASYEITEKAEVISHFKKMLVPPVYTTPPLKFNKEKNLRGFYDIKATHDYIFTLFSGKPESATAMDDYALIPETLVILSPKGKILNKIQLNHKGYRFALSEDGKKLYHFILNPEFDIEVYDVNDLIKR